MKIPPHLSLQRQHRVQTLPVPTPHIHIAKEPLNHPHGPVQMPVRFVHRTLSEDPVFHVEEASVKCDGGEHHFHPLLMLRRYFCQPGFLSGFLSSLPLVFNDGADPLHALCINLVLPRDHLQGLLVMLLNAITVANLGHLRSKLLVNGGRVFVHYISNRQLCHDLLVLHHLLLMHLLGKLPINAMIRPQLYQAPVDLTVGALQLNQVRRPTQFR
mmetsp:Transcript_7376/g.9978  ORF Transcript_7376/g.9978 Transcript_7376/m.9978 type:complete len:214 (+) Transcript_7376:838-1479(+)